MATQGSPGDSPPPKKTRKSYVLSVDDGRVDIPNLPTEERDLDYSPPKSFTTPPPRENTGRHRFRQCGESVETLDRLHKPDEEAKMFEEFRKGVEKSLTPKPSRRHGFYYESRHGVWISTAVRYTDDDMKETSVEENEEKTFFRKFNGTASSVVDLIGKVMRLSPGKPIVVQVGCQSVDDYLEPSNDQEKQPGDFPAGHAVVLALYPSGNGYAAAVKDSNPVVKVKVVPLVYEVLVALKVPLVELVGLQKKDVFSFNTDCIRETYKVIGGVLDGDFFWDEGAKGATKKYNVALKTQVVE